MYNNAYTPSVDSKEIKPVNPKGNRPWIFIGRPDAEAEAPILWPPDAKSRCKEPTHWERLWCWERLRTGGEEGDRGWDYWMASPTERHDFGQILGDSEGQGSLVCCSLLSCRVGHSWVTEQPQKGRKREKNRRKKFLCLWNLHATESIQVTNEIHSTFSCDKYFLERKELEKEDRVY